MSDRHFDLYPPPGETSTPPTWDDVLRLARHYPAARHAVVMVERGEWTREQALIRLVYALAASFQQLFQAEVDRRQLQPTSFIFQGFPMSETPLQRVQVVNREHPHFEEYGRFTGKIITMRFSGESMAEVALENCRHGGDACFVNKGDVKQVVER